MNKRGVVALAVLMLIGGWSVFGSFNIDKLDLDHLHDNDTIAYKEIMDTIGYFAGRDAETGLRIAKLLETKVATFDNQKISLNTKLKIAELYFLTGKTDSAKQYINHGIALSEEYDDPYKLMGFLYLKGRWNHQQGCDDVAYETYQRGLSIAYDINCISKQVAFLSSMALCEYIGDDLSLSTGYLRKAKAICEENELTGFGNYTSVLYNLASNLQQIGKPDSALMIYDELRTIYEQKNYLSGLAALGNNVAHIYKEKGEFDLAIDNAFEALEYDKKTGTVIYIIGDYVTIGKIYNTMSLSDSALHYFVKADSIAKSNHIFRKRKEITQFIADLNAQNRNYKDAYEMLCENLMIRDSLNVVSVANKIEELERKFQLKEKEKENEILRLKAQKRDKIIDFQKIILVLFVFIGITLAIFFVSVRSKNKKIKNLNYELRQHNDRLSNENITKNKLLSIISHDLRGPIGNIKNMISSINDNSIHMNRDDFMRFMNVVEQELFKTFDLLENLLSWASAQFAKIDVIKKDIKVRAMVDNTITPLVSLAEHKHIDLIVEIDKDIQITSDPEMLMFIIRNMVNNAIKYTDNGGWVKITGNCFGRYCNICISDNGVGMSDDQQKQLFNPDDLTSTNGTNQEKGNGLGLVLSKEFAEKIKVDFDISSTLGSGTTICLVIPN